jgi:hypothetical protein
MDADLHKNFVKCQNGEVNLAHTLLRLKFVIFYYC